MWVACSKIQPRGWNVEGRWMDERAYSLEDGGPDFYVSVHFDVMREIWRFDWDLDIN
jgi:hypothetical protein